MNARAKTLLQALSFTTTAALLVACGYGELHAAAPGPFIAEEPPPVNNPPEDAGTEPPPPPPPPEDAGPGCTTTARDLTPEEDLGLFVDEGLPDRFQGQCLGCHAASGTSPSGSGTTWGVGGSANNTPEKWHEAVLGILDRPDQQGAAPEQTRLYGAFSAAFQPVFHKLNAEAQAEVVEWLTGREEGIEETVCVDAGVPGPGPGPGTDAGPGPGPGPGPGGLPTEQQSSDCFAALGIGDALVPQTCNICHVATSGKTPTGTGTPTVSGWGNTADDPAAWHAAFWGKAKQENAAADPTTSVLYTHLDGINAAHSEKPPIRDPTGEWLDYVLNGVKPAACP